MAGHHRGRDPDTAVGDRGVDSGHLQGGHVNALAERDLVTGVAGAAGPLAGRSEQAAARAGQVQAGIRADAERAEHAVLLSRGDVVRHLDHAVVERVRDDPGDRVALGLMRLGVVIPGAVPRHSVGHDVA